MPREKKFDLTDAEYLGLKTLEKRLRCIFYSYNVPGSFEDFFSTYNLEYRIGLHQHQRLEHYAIDYIRSKLGSTGRKSDSAKVLEYKESMDAATEEEHTNSLIDLKCEISKLEGRHRVIAGLMLIHCLNSEEIAFLMDLTPSRISHMIHDITIKSRKSAKWSEDRTLSLSDIEKAAEILDVPTLWLRNKIDELH